MKIWQRERFTIITNNVSITGSWDCLYCPFNTLRDSTNNPKSPYYDFVFITIEQPKLIRNIRV